MSQFISMIQMR